MHCLQITDIVSSKYTKACTIVEIHLCKFIISFLIFLQLLELIPTAWQGNLLHPLQNGCWHILCHETWEGSLACSQESLPLAHKLENSSNALQWPTVISILLWSIIIITHWRSGNGKKKQQSMYDLKYKTHKIKL